MAHRPLSPYLNYRFAYTMLLSFAHRLTGVALSAGFIVLVLWLMSAAQGATSFGRFEELMGHGPIQVLLAALLIAFIFHFANGIRHLFWDIGWGLERAQARRSAAVVVILVALVSAAMVWALFVGGSAT